MWNILLPEALARVLQGITPRPSHTVFPVGFPCSPLGSFCVFVCITICVCVWQCVTTQLKQPLHFPTSRSRQLHWYFSVAVTDSSANAEIAANSTSPADELLQRSGNCWWKLLSFQVGVLSARLLPLWDPGVFPLHKEGLSQVSLTRREKSMVRKARRSSSKWDSGMPMVHLKPRESGDVWMVFFVSLCG